jgi:predicted aspartyl protease
MTRRLVLACAVLLGLASPAPAAEQPYRIAAYGGLFTDVYLNGQGPFSFLIDTGASNSLIYEHVRKALNLSQSQPGQLVVYGVNDVAAAVPVRPRTLRVAGEEIADLTMGVLPDPALDLGDGVLGLDVLQRYFVAIDRQALRFGLLPPVAASARPYAGWTQTKITARRLKSAPAQFWYLSMRFNERRFPALLDLGATSTLINWNAAGELGVRKVNFDRNGPPPEDLQDLLGKTAPALRILDLRIGVPGKMLDRQTLIVADAPAFGYFDLGGAPAAIVGPGLLRDTSLAIDFAQGTLYLGPTLDAR